MNLLDCFELRSEMYYFCAMGVVKNFFQFYIYSNMHVAFAVSCLCMITGAVFNINTTNSALFMGLSTFFSYNAIRYFKYQSSQLRPQLNVWFSRNITILLLLNVFAFLGMCLLFYYLLSVMLVMFLLPFVVITTAYMLPLNCKNKKTALRKVPGLKIFLISVTWASLVVGFPLVANTISVGLFEGKYFLLVCVYVFVLTLPFDIRDLDFDTDALKTIPQLLGVFRTKILGVVLLLLCMLLFLIYFHSDIWFSFSVSAMCLLFLLCMSTANQPRFYASFLVEGIPIFQYLLLCYCKHYT
jgi:hypothetical protein